MKVSASREEIAAREENLAQMDAGNLIFGARLQAIMATLGDLIEASPDPAHYRALIETRTDSVLVEGKLKSDDSAVTIRTWQIVTERRAAS